MEISRRKVLTGSLGALSLLPLERGFAAAAATEHPVVRTRHGPVRGFRDNGISVFRGIRYGADTGPRRFMPPLPPPAWQSATDCFAYGPAAPQDRTRETTSEDCLFLNVWTPGAGTNARRPVLFYIHGGAYSHGSGSSPLYDGGVLARRDDVVVVTVNHRLNALGYLYLQRLAGNALADAGNAGQLDLVLALRWVRRNIAAFGGDPERVLAFGQSGGGAKIATMMAMPAAAGLFQRAATMSGQQVTASGPLNATERTHAYLDELGVAPDDVETLRTLPVERLVAALSADDPVLGFGSVYFGPVLDMRTLTRHPFYPDASPQSAQMPMIIGNTHDETRAFLRGGQYQDLEWDDLPELLIPNLRIDIRPEFVVAEYRKLFPKYSPTQVFFAATTAGRSWRGAIVELEERAKQDGAPTYAYQLDFGSPLDPEMGAPHGFDIPLVFGNLEAGGSRTGTGVDAKAVSAMLGGAFTAFARTGVPTQKALPNWLPYTLPGRETLLVDKRPAMVSDPRGNERRIFERVPYIQPGT